MWAASRQPLRRPWSHPSHRPWSRILLTALTLVAAAALAGCGGGNRSPSLRGLPLVSGVHTLVRQKACDKGTHAYCALELVVAARGYRNSRSLARAEKALLKRRGWAKVNAPVGLELAADSPGDRLRVTYASAESELQAIDLGWVKRPHRLTLTLSRAIFDHDAAMALLLQMGTNS